MKHGNSVLGISFVLFIGISMTHSANSSDNRPTEVALTPEAAVAKLLKAATDGDLESFGLQLEGHSKLIFEAGQAVTKLQRTVEEHFGKKEASKMKWPMFEDDLKPYSGRTFELRAAVPIGDRKLALTVWMRNDDSRQICEQTWITVWDGKCWKLILPLKGIIKRSTRRISGKEVTVETLISRAMDKKAQVNRDALFRSMKRSCEMLAIGVKSGKYAKPKDFVAALNRARQAPLKSK